MALEDDWEDDKARGHLSTAETAIHIIRMDRLDNRISEMDILWQAVGDKCSKEFFEFTSQGKSRIHIAELHHEGRSATSQPEIRNLLIGYYQKLYTKDTRIDRNQSTLDQCLQSIPKVVTNEQNQILLQDISRREPTLAGLSIPLWKAPGLDRIPVEFFQKCLDQALTSLW